MPRKIRTSNVDILNKLKELLDNYHEIYELEDKLNQEKLVITLELQKCLNYIKENIVSKL